MSKSDDTIRRQDAIKEIARWIGYLDEDMILRIQTGLKKLPSAKSERKVGHWIDDCTCSVCYWTNEDGEGFALLTNYSYCPNCGTKMDKGGDAK